MRERHRAEHEERVRAVPGRRAQVEGPAGVERGGGAAFEHRLVRDDAAGWQHRQRVPVVGERVAVRRVERETGQRWVRDEEPKLQITGAE